MFGMGHQELLIILLIVLLVFGGKKIPEVARGLGRAMREFRRARDDFGDALREEDEADRKVEQEREKAKAAARVAEKPTDASAASGDGDRRAKG